jgi:hypothetical protein
VVVFNSLCNVWVCVGVCFVTCMCFGDMCIVQGDDKVSVHLMITVQKHANLF